MKTILLLETDVLIRKAIAFKLRKDGYKIITGVDGKEGMLLIEQESFDLLITNIMLPFNSGLEIIKKIKALKGPTFPAVVLSKIGLEDVVTEAFKIGADDYVTKPFSPIELSMRVQRLLPISS